MRSSTARAENVRITSEVPDMTVDQVTDVITLDDYRSPQPGGGSASAVTTEGSWELSEDSKSKLRTYLVKLRRDTDGATFIVPAVGERRAHQLGVAQWQVALLLDLATRNYRELEAGRGRWNAERVELIVHAFNLGEKERSALYRLALGRSPGPRSDPAAERFAADFVDSLVHPAHVLDQEFVLVHRNESHAQWLSELEVGDNYALWMLTGKTARLRFPRWMQWAESVVWELHRRHAGAGAAEREGLEVLVKRCCGDGVVSALWERRHNLVNPAASVRAIRTPCGQRAVTEWTTTSGTHRITAYLPVGQAATATPTTRPDRIPVAA